jgi:hypothetical protein
MRGAIPPLPQYVFMAWCSVKHRETLPLPFTFSKPSFYIGVELGLSQYVQNIGGRLQVLQNKVLRIIMDLRDKDVAGVRRYLYNEDLHNL